MTQTLLLAILFVLSLTAAIVFMIRCRVLTRQRNEARKWAEDYARRFFDLRAATYPKPKPRIVSIFADGKIAWSAD